MVVRDADCHVSTDAYTGYFTNQLPDLFRTSTSADGVFAVLNVPPGDYTVELYAPVPGRAAEDQQPHVRAGSATLTLEADGATVVLLDKRITASLKNEGLARDIVRNIQSEGIVASGNWMFGFDWDGPEVFEETWDFLERSRIIHSSFTTEIPFPGTAS